MKFLYVDESGKGEETILVLAGILADAQRMHVTKAEWREILERLSGILKKPVSELHTKELYRGRGIWREMNGEQRSQLIKLLIDWMAARKHHLYFSAIDKELLGNADPNDDRIIRHPNGNPNHWMMSALHILLTVQKANQGASKNKGHTVVVFDKGVDEETITDLAISPPVWTDSFYGYEGEIGIGKRRRPNPVPRLPNIIDSPYFADSRHAPLVQVADLFAYIIRHYTELVMGRVSEQYNGETEKVAGWMKSLAGFLQKDATRWLKAGGCDCSNLFREIAPEPLREIQKNLT